MAPSAQGTTWNPGFCMASICLLRRESRSSSCTVKLGDFSWYCWKDESKVTKKQMDTCFQDDVSNRKCKFIIIHFWGVNSYFVCPGNYQVGERYKHVNLAQGTRPHPRREKQMESRPIRAGPTMWREFWRQRTQLVLNLSYGPAWKGVGAEA